MADGHHLVPELASPTADGRHDTHAHSSTAVIVHQDTDGAYVQYTRPPTRQDHAAREPRDTSLAPSLQSERATLLNSVVPTGPDIAQILDSCFQKEACVKEERRRREGERKRADEKRQLVELRRLEEERTKLEEDRRREEHEERRHLEEARVQREERQLVELRRFEDERASREEERRRLARNAIARSSKSVAKRMKTEIGCSLHLWPKSSLKSALMSRRFRHINPPFSLISHYLSYPLYVRKLCPLLSRRLISRSSGILPPP